MSSTAGYVHEVIEDQYKVFNKEAIAICKKIMANEMRNKDLAMQLKENWIKTNVIPPDAKYNEVANNPALMKTLLMHLASGLSDKPEESRYGNKIISDFDLYFNCQTDKALNAKLKELNRNITYVEGVDLARKRTNLAEFVRRTKNIVLDNMDLIGYYYYYYYHCYNSIFYLGAPDRSNHNAKPKPIKTRDEVIRSVIQSEEKIGEKNRNDVNVANLIAQPLDNECVDMTVDNEVIVNKETYLIGDKRPRTDEEVEEVSTELEDLQVDDQVKRKKLSELVLSIFPWANIHGIYMIINDDGEILTANEVLTEKFYREYEATFNK